MIPLLPFLFLFFFTACDSPKMGQSGIGGAGFQSGGDSTNASNAGSETAGSTVDQSFATLPPKVEIRSFVDPYSGNITTKLPLPKNFAGDLYMQVINATSLEDKLVKVRFYFGQELYSVELDATLARTSNITPQMDMQLLAVNMRSAPFSDLRLLYDLYDYNQYSVNDTPTMDPTNPNLYCRGLQLQHDPSFNYSASNNVCNVAGQSCYYAYAKIRDVGLYDPSGMPTSPITPMINIGSYDFNNTLTDSTSILARNTRNLNKCLPDDGKLYFQNSNGYLQLSYDSSTLKASYGQQVLSVLASDGSSINNYTYYGPYRAINVAKWAISSVAVFGPGGLFLNTIDNTGDVNKGLSSLLFPRGATLNIGGINRQYMGSTNPFKGGSNVTVNDTRQLLSLPNGGDTLWMDGCNQRVRNFDTLSNEGIHSCNVTAIIEIWIIDPKTSKKNMIYSTSSMKIQILRPTIKDVNGNEVLFQSLKSCESSSACGKNECCYNTRCWSKNVISRCMEEAQTIGNKLVGERCSSDYECISFCCDSSKGVCNSHNPDLENPVYCSKPPGSSCLSKEWCRQDPVQICKIIKTGVNMNGKDTCALRCFSQYTFGDCLNAVCVPPSQPVAPSFAPSTFDCSTAENPPLNSSTGATTSSSSSSSSSSSQSSSSLPSASGTP